MGTTLKSGPNTDFMGYDSRFYVFFPPYVYQAVQVTKYPLSDPSGIKNKTGVEEDLENCTIVKKFESLVLSLCVQSVLQEITFTLQVL